MGNVSSTLPSPPIPLEAILLGLLPGHTLIQVLKLGRFLKTILVLTNDSNLKLLVHVYIPPECDNVQNLSKEIEIAEGVFEKCTILSEEGISIPIRIFLGNYNVEDGTVCKLFEISKELADENLQSISGTFSDTSNIRVWISVRPFLPHTLSSWLEYLNVINNSKSLHLWMTYQIISRISKLFDLGMAHGDLSRSSFLISGSGRIYIQSDQAFLKPWRMDRGTNISDWGSVTFLYFYDKGHYDREEVATFDKASCSIAPERFSCDFDENSILARQTADIYSLGHLLYQIWDVLQEVPLASNGMINQILKV